MTNKEFIVKIEQAVTKIDRDTAKNIVEHRESRDYDRGLKMGAFFAALTLTNMAFDPSGSFIEYSDWQKDLLELHRTNKAYLAKHFPKAATASEIVECGDLTHNIKAASPRTKASLEALGDVLHSSSTVTA